LVWLPDFAAFRRRSGDGFDLGVSVPVSFDAAVDGQVHGSEQAVTFVVPSGLDTVCCVFVVEQIDAFSDQDDRGLKETAIDGDRAIFCHGSARHKSEVVLEVIGSSSQALHMVCEGLPGGFAGGAVTALVIGVAPGVPGGIEGIQGHGVRQGGQELHSYGPVEPFNFSFPLRLVWFCVNESDGKGGADVLELMAAVSGTVVDVMLRSPLCEDGSRNLDCILQ